MAENSKIEWCDHTVNLWWGCSKVHTGCKNCYALTLSNRFGGGIWGEKAPRKLIKSAFKDLAKYQKQGKKEGKKLKVFVGSMMDILEDDKPMVNHKGQSLTMTIETQRQILFQAIEKGMYPNLIFLFLTKRPQNLKTILSKQRTDWIEKGLPENVWVGASISNQNTADDILGKLLKNGVKGNYFLSVEPQVGHIDLSGYLLGKEDVGGALQQPIKWIIQGGESGSNKRPFDLAWANSMREQCKKAGVAYFFKQIDKVQEIPKELLVREFPLTMRTRKDMLELHYAQTVGLKLIEILYLSKLTKVQLAERIGVSLSQIEKVLKGSYVVPSELRVKLNNYLKIGNESDD